MIGHEIAVQELDDIVHVLRCECGWIIAVHRDEVERSKRMHWIAKRAEQDVLG